MTLELNLSTFYSNGKLTREKKLKKKKQKQPLTPILCVFYLLSIQADFEASVPMYYCEPLKGKTPDNCNYVKKRSFEGELSTFHP